MAPPVVMGASTSASSRPRRPAAVGSLYALLVATLVYRNFGFADLWECANQTMRTSMMLFMIIVGAAIFGHAITIIRLPVGVTEAVASMGLGPLGSS